MQEFLDSFLKRPYMVWATCSYLFLSIGLFYRKRNRLKHARLMSLGIFLDLALVLILQIERNAVGTTVRLALTPLQLCHVFASLIATVLYFPTLYFGFKLLRSEPGNLVLRKKHLRFSKAAFFFRTAGFLFMFSLLSRTNVH